mmetsp:Transcript_12335/g.43455  ORF Transcript_12335/g.43455 Transcript_12335/m.43455 type:complete len:315 (+) Transcript_12335:588-1532(+)
MQNALHDQQLRLGLCEDLELGNVVAIDHRTFDLVGEHLLVHLVRHLQVLHHCSVSHHVRVENDFDAILPRLLVLLLGQLAEDVHERVRNNGVQLRAMHVLQWRAVVVLQCELVANLRQKAVVHAWMSQVVRYGCNQQDVLFQVREEGLRGDDVHEARGAVRNIHRMGEVVEWDGEVLPLHGAHEALEALLLVLRRHEAVACFVEARDRKDSQRRALGLRQWEGIEAPRLVDLLGDTKVLQAHRRDQGLLPWHCARLARLCDGLLLVNDVLTLHHAQDAKVLVLHVFCGVQLIGALQIRDDGELLNDLLQQLHLV